MSRKVLIIEDRRENIVFIANNILKPEGWEVITARDGKLGLQKAIEEKPDLIITDLKLPTMHGLDVLEELNKRGYHIPTIVMTFHGSEETAIRAFRLGAVDYLIKPFEIDHMLDAIDRALQPATVAQSAPARWHRRNRGAEACQPGAGDPTLAGRARATGACSGRQGWWHGCRSLAGLTQREGCSAIQPEEANDHPAPGDEPASQLSQGTVGRERCAHSQSANPVPWGAHCSRRTAGFSR